MKHPNHEHPAKRSLILLDVDGVINDLGALGGTRRPWETDIVVSHGFRLHIPRYMPQLIGALVDSASVVWCTTWRERANGEIAAHLGIPHLPVVTDGTDERSVLWKAEAARDLVEDALRDGRSVFWIEDFYGEPPLDGMPQGIVFVDTTRLAPRGVLTPADLPSGLRSLVGTSAPTGGGS